MTTKNERDGFLAGVPIGDDGEPIDAMEEQAKLLGDIKRDTSTLVDVARAQLRSTHRAATVTPAGRAGQWSPRGQAGAMGPSMRAAMPADRGRSGVARDSAGRFIGRDTPTGRETRLDDFAAAADSLAETAEQQRRDDRADRQSAPAARRDAAGRFQGPGAQAPWKAAMPHLPSVGGAGAMDPLLAGAGEALTFLRPAASAVVPSGRGLLRPDRVDEPAGLLRRVWRELRAMRKADASASRSTLAKLAELGKPGAGGNGSGNGLLGGLLGSLLPALPTLLGPLAAVGGGVALALKAAGSLVRRLPVLGALFEGITGVLEDQRIAADTTLSPGQQRQQRAANAGGTLGGIGGALAGLAAGQALIPIPVVGAVVGAAVGGFLGNKAGGAVGGGVGRAAQRWSSGARNDIVGGAAAAGVDPGLVAQIAAFESGFNPGARPIGKDGRPMSSAHGYGQFIDSTWVDTVRKHGQKHGVAGASLLTNEQALSLRGDSKLQAAMLAELTAENVAAGRALGGKDDAANVYALHNLGAGDGPKFLKALAATPDAPVSSILSRKVIENNPALYRGGAASVADAYAVMGRKMAAGSQFAADARSVPPIAQVAAVALPKAAAVPHMPSVPAAAVVPPVHAEQPIPTRLNTELRPAAAAPAPSPLPSQDVGDRLIAHIVTGGIGGFAAVAGR